MELVRGNVTDRPWGQTLGALALKGLTGQVSIMVDDKAYAIAFDLGAIVAATSPLVSDAVVRIAMTSHLISKASVNDITRRIAAAPDRDEVDVIAEATNLTADHVESLRRKVIAQRASRTFSLELGEFVVDDTIRLPTVPGIEIDVRTVVYAGARMNVSEARMTEALHVFGTHFILKPDAVATIAHYGFTEDVERMIVDELRVGSSLPEIEAAHRDIDPRTSQAIIYALMSCGALEPQEAPAIPRAGTASSLSPQTIARALGTPRTTNAPPNVARTVSGQVRTTDAPPTIARTTSGSVDRKPGSQSGSFLTRPASPTTEPPSFDTATPRTPIRARTSTGSREFEDGAATPAAIRASRGKTTGAPATRPITSDPTIGRTPTPGFGQGQTTPTPGFGQGQTTPTHGFSHGQTTPGFGSGQSTPGQSFAQGTPGQTTPSRTFGQNSAGQTTPSRTSTPRAPTANPITGRTTTPRPPSDPQGRTSPITRRSPSGAPVERTPSEDGISIRSQTPTGQPATARVPTGPLLSRTSTARRTKALIAARMILVEQGADHFALLGIPFDAPVELVRQTYSNLSKQLHPDKLAELGVVDISGTASQLFAHLGHAFTVLTEPEKRGSYMALLLKQETLPPPPRTKTGDEAPPGSALEAFRKGESALRRDEPREACIEFAKAVELEPNDVDYQAMLGWAQFCAATDRTAAAPKAKQALDRAIQKSTKPVYARFLYGRIERMMGRDREALRHFQEVLELQPNHAEAASEVRVIEARLASAKKR